MLRYNAERPLLRQKQGKLYSTYTHNEKRASIAPSYRSRNGAGQSLMKKERMLCVATV
jgi:hypothetical protein